MDTLKTRTSRSIFCRLPFLNCAGGSSISGSTSWRNSVSLCCASGSGRRRVSWTREAAFSGETQTRVMAKGNNDIWPSCGRERKVYPLTNPLVKPSRQGSRGRLDNGDRQLPSLSFRRKSPQQEPVAQPAAQHLIGQQSEAGAPGDDRLALAMADQMHDALDAAFERP